MQTHQRKPISINALKKLITKYSNIDNVFNYIDTDQTNKITFLSKANIDEKPTSPNYYAQTLEKVHNTCSSEITKQKINNKRLF